MTTPASCIQGSPHIPLAPIRHLWDRHRVWLILLAASLVLRSMAMSGVVLVPEEAYYWLYAQHPDLSYFDHPPMVAWVIRAGTFLAGDTELGVRLVGGLLLFAASGAMYLFARMWFGRTPALIAAAALQILPVYSGAALIATMDAPLVFFWLLCLLGLSHALKHGRTSGWYLAGAAMGAAMLSKYTGVFLGVGGVIVVLGHSPWRRHLLSPHPYLAAALAMALFSPVLVWNASHDWASFRFQFIERFAGHHVGLDTVLAYLVVQLAVATPIVLIGVIWLAAHPLRRRRLTPRWWIAVAFCLPLLIVMAQKSLHSDIHLNWMLPAYLSVIPAAIRLTLAEGRRHRLRTGRPPRLNGLVMTAAICIALNAAMHVFLLGVQPRTRALSQFGPWASLAEVVEEWEDRLEAESKVEPLIIGGGKYRLASVLAFYRVPIEDSAPTPEYTTSQWLIQGSGLGFEYWSAPSRWLGETCLYIDDGEALPRELLECFDSVEQVYDPRLAALGHEMAICRGYRGPLSSHH